MRFLYSIAIRSYGLGIAIAAIFSLKAKQWIRGRKNWQSVFLTKNQQGIWMHCASAGEFEQGRPVLEAIRRAYPTIPLTLSFFSPSGFEMRKNYDGVDAVGYLPLDTKRNALEILDLVKPRLIILVKYEIWHNLLHQASIQDIPVTLVSAIFRNEQIYWKSWGSWFLNSLKSIDFIFCQNQSSADLLRSRGVDQVYLAGDTRFDRVSAIAKNPTNLPAFIVNWLGNHKAIVAGSTWPKDEEILLTAIKNRTDIKIILVPHEIHNQHVDQLINLWPSAQRFSNFSGQGAIQTLIIDRMGMLSSLYQAATFAYVGGGFGAGIHNTLEPAAFGKPVVFGPNYSKFQEARDLVKLGGGFSIQSVSQATELFDKLLDQFDIRQGAGQVALNYVQSESGATEKIMTELQKIFISIADVQTEQL